MIKKILTLILCATMLFCFTSCGKESLDVIRVNDTRYLLEKDKYPDCFEEIISKTNYK